MASPDNQPASALSLIIPTYTGEECIEKCLKSIRDQQGTWPYELVIVIDGPNERLREIVENTRDEFGALPVPVTIHQFSKNRGRFTARKKGAELAHYETLVFIDDRVTLAPDFLKSLQQADEPLMLANIIEANQPTLISRVLYLLRRWIYGRKKWGKDAESYYITANNFERSPKGGTGLWTPRSLFLEACRAVEDISHGDSKDINDDTKLLHFMLDKTGSIYKCAQAIACYYPRSSWQNEGRHLYERGPKFVDYYLRRGSRFRPHLMAALLGFLMVIIGAALFGQLFILTIFGLAIVGLLAFSVLLQEDTKDIAVLAVGLPLVVALFGVGVMKGIITKPVKNMKAGTKV